MEKPVKPERKVLVSRCEYLYFDCVSKKISLDYFIQWCREEIPPKAEDVTIELVDDHQYDDSLTYLQLAWKELQPNKKYEQQLKKYRKDLERWKKQNKLNKRKLND